MFISHLFYADDAMFIGEWSEQNLHNIVKVLNCFHLASGLKINIAKSLAKIQWAIEGDENSKFFHGIINRKRANLSVKGILVEGDWVDEPSRIKDEFRNHFATIFQDPGPSRGSINFIFPNCLNPEQASDLESPVTRDEIRNAVWELWCYTNLMMAYLDEVLNSVGFGSKWRSWMRGLVYHLVWLRILIKASPTSEFLFHCGAEADALISYDSLLFYADGNAVFIGEWSQDNLLGLSLLNGYGDLCLKTIPYGVGSSLPFTVIKLQGIDIISHCKIRIGNGCYVADKILSSVTTSFRRPVRGGHEAQQLSCLLEILEPVILSNMEDRWVWDMNGDGVFRVKDVRNLLDDTLLPKVLFPYPLGQMCSN
ncbi:hypothetical protein Tco_0935682 [Tanacetum coccineum]